ncbi:MAG: SMP-30/gluconolactonase/LRE family protein [Chloroflexota bacterium]
MKIHLDIHDQRIIELLDPALELEQLETGFDFVEGPIWHPTKSALVFSDILGNSLYRWTEKDGLTTLRRNSYMANGNAYDVQGRIVTCEHATSRVTRTDFAKDAELESLATHYDGKELNSPNDIVVSSGGLIYFTDPVPGRGAMYGVPREPELDISGVYLLNPDTGDLVLMVDDFEKPNGLCFSRDEKQLFINDSDRFHIRVFNVEKDGSLSDGRVWADTVSEGAGVPDGIKIDQQDNIYCCVPGGFQIFGKDGSSLGLIHMPEQAANLCFGEADMQSLFITASTSLYRLRVNSPGHKTFEG